MRQPKSEAKRRRRKSGVIYSGGLLLFWIMLMSLLFLLLFVPCVRGSHNESEKQESGRGDPTCNSTDSRSQEYTTTSWLFRIPRSYDGSVQAPCRVEDNVDSSNDDANGTASSDVSIGEPGTNYIYFNVFVALPPYQQSLGSILKVAVTAYLNVTSSDYHYRIASSNQSSNNNNRTTSTTPQQVPQEAALALWEWALSILDTIVGRNTENKVADLFLVYYEPQTVLKADGKWWWKYTFKYKCFWVDSGEPIVDPAILTEIRSNTEELLHMALQYKSLQDMIFERINHAYNFIVIQMEDPRTQPDEPAEPERSPDDTEHKNATAAPSASPPTATTVSSEPLHGDFDQHEWDWRRYVGLGMLLGTATSTLCFITVANMRRARRRKKQTWGNLATEEGVDEILRNGWKIRDGKIEIYDKQGVGYSDSGSMLMGGYQQSELVGTEISMTPTTISPRHSQRFSSSSQATP